MHSLSPLKAMLILAYGLTMASGAKLPLRQVQSATGTSPTIIPFAPTAPANSTGTAVSIHTSAFAPSDTAATLPVFDSALPSGSGVSTAGSSAATAGTPLSGTTPASYYTCGRAAYLYCCPSKSVEQNPTVPEEFSASGCTYEGDIATPNSDFGPCSGSGTTALCCSYHVTSNTTTIDLPDICLQGIPHAGPATAVTTVVGSTPTSSLAM